ncbi:TetR/AcrR family transcriptional regulator [Pedobacter sp. SYP-B3415]|uniref:TetR/AcrR family transcriptional regulator n=1 Tax=Pedobacter sp. SYP-B3415 TaxID=2496641 RepID=UPI00101CB1CC|nr:TetR/AcrR family transcriptional regulator [Pedobacter sp. SYP-B3415]
MGIKERKSRAKEDLKKAILDAAKRLFSEKGFTATSMRNIAELIEFSPTTIYLYYKDKNEILFALHQEGFRLMQDKFSALQHVEEPFERLKAMGRMYLEFAEQNRDYYDLMFVMEEPVELCFKSDSEWEEGMTTYGGLYQTILACQQSGYFKGFEPHGLSLTIWSMVHGLCTLSATKRLEHMVDKKDMIPGLVIPKRTYVFETFVKMLERIN